jgi:hypothetical protein
MHVPCLTGRISRSDGEAGKLFGPSVDRNALYWLSSEWTQGHDGKANE